MSVDLLPSAPSFAPLAPALDAPPEPPSGNPVEASPPGVARHIDRLVTTIIVVAPLLALIFGVVWFWGEAIHLRDIVIGLVLFAVVGHGITVGFHRLLSHKSFAACRPLKLALVGAGSMAFEGGPIGWVADHRRHHVFSDQPGDPHSPHQVPKPVGRHAAADAGRGARHQVAHRLRAQLRGLAHAHVGWLFTPQRTSRSRYAADLVADRDLVVMNALFPVWCLASLALPFGLGWLLGGSVGAALTALLWAGGVRIFLLHHVTWSINSICHMFGRRPFATSDRSTNVGALSLVTMGESWHNGHHAFPRSARHGLLPGQWDSSAVLIRGFERVGWARDVHWPTPEAIQRRVQGASRAGRR